MDATGRAIWLRRCQPTRALQLRHSAGLPPASPGLSPATISRRDTPVAESRLIVTARVSGVPPAQCGIGGVERQMIQRDAGRLVRQPGMEGVAQAVPHEVDREHRQVDGKASQTVGIEKAATETAVALLSNQEFRFRSE